jgi:hypothetical protein
MLIQHDDDDDDFAPRQPSGKRARQPSLTASKRGRTGSGSSAKNDVDAFFVSAAAAAAAQPSGPLPRSATPSRLSFGSSAAAPASRQQPQEQPPGRGARHSLCPSCGQDLAKFSDTEVGRHAHVNHCLDAAPAGAAAAAAPAAAACAAAAAEAHEVLDVSEGASVQQRRRAQEEGRPGGQQQQAAPALDTSSTGQEVQEPAAPGIQAW